MAKTLKSSIDLQALQVKLRAQLTGLDANDPSSWPLVPRYALCFVVAVAVVVALWFTWLSTSDEELTAEQGKENQLKDDYKKKLVQAVNLEGLKKQREQVQQYVTQLE